MHTDRVLRMFDVAGRERDSIALRLCQTQRSSHGQKGLVSEVTTTLDAR